MGFILFVVIVALVFDFINGFHDAANSIATVVGTRVLSPRTAVIWAAFFNFVAAFAFETRVAKTIGKDIVDPSIVDPVLILAGLVGAIAWNLLTWWWGLPSSSSHALIGGFAGAALAKGGLKVLVAKGLEKTAAFIVLSPLFGLALGFVFFLSVIWIFRRARPEPVDRIFRRVQLFSAAAFSFGHGLNDAQKTMGIIAVLLFSTGHLKHLEIPFWIILLCRAGTGLGITQARRVVLPDVAAEDDAPLAPVRVELQPDAAGAEDVPGIAEHEFDARHHLDRLAVAHGAELLQRVERVIERVQRLGRDAVAALRPLAVLPLRVALGHRR